MKNNIAMKIGVIVLIISLLSFVPKNICLIKKVYGFYTISTGGNIAVDIEGKPLQSNINVLYTIFVETNSNNFKWDSLKIGKVQFAISSSTIEFNSPITIGKIKNINTDYTIIPMKGNQMCKLEIQSDELINESSLKYKQVILKGKCKNHAVSYIINNMIELEAPLYP